MKILHVNKFFDLHGGAEFYLHGLISRQRAAGHEVHAFSTRSERNRQTADEKFFVTRFAYDAKEGPWKDLRKAVNFVHNSEARESFAEMVAEIKPDVIHLHNIYHHLSTSIFKPIKESGAYCVQTLHDYKLACPNYKMFTQGSACEKCKGGHYCQAIKNDCLNGFFASALAAFEMSYTKMRQSYESGVDAFICPSKFLRDKMVEWGEPPSKMVYLPNPVDMPDRLPNGRGTGPYVYIGRLSKEKGVETIIRAFARMPDKELAIIGRGAEEPVLRTIARELKADNINFLGFLSGGDLEKWRVSAKALLMPTLMYENSSLAILEAMANGVPAIGSSIGGIPELVQDGLNGLLATPGNVDSWMEAVNEMDGFTLEQRLGMGEAGYEHVKSQNTWESHLSRLDQIYKMA